MSDGTDKGDPVGAKVNSQGAELLSQQVVESKSVELLSVESVTKNLTVPSDALPTVLRAYVLEAAQAICCPPDYIAVPLLVGLGAAIGRTRRLQIKRGWEESAALWTMIVGYSGTAKTPAIEAALKPVFDISDSAQWMWVNDTTVEALAQVMAEKPRGVILIRDELSGWIRGFDQYKGGRGSDEQFFLEAWSGTPARITRKRDKNGNGDRFTIRQPFLSICGGIQPSVLSKLVSQDRIESGFAARFLLSYPQRMLRQYTKDEVSEDTANNVRDLYRKLQELEFTSENEPLVMRFSNDGEREWCRWIESHQQETSSLDPNSPLVTAWSKMDGYAARIMLILHIVRHASGEVASEEVDAETVRMAERLIEYFKDHALRVYSEALGRKPSTPPPKALPVDDRAVQWILRKGNKGVQPRDLQIARIAPTAAEAKAILDGLARHGVGVWTKRDGKTAARFYVKSTLNTQQPADQEAA